jgi:hypothetical protein
MYLLIDILAVFLDSLLEFLLLSLRLQGTLVTTWSASSESLFPTCLIKIAVLLLLIHQLILDTLVLLSREREIITFPLPMHVPLAVIFLLIKDASCANLLIDNRSGLQSIRENNVRVHSCNINVIDQGFDLIDRALPLDEFELSHNLLLDLFIVGHEIFVNVQLDLQSEIHD